MGRIANFLPDLDLPTWANIWVAIGTLALAVVTFFALQQARRESRRAREDPVAREVYLRICSRMKPLPDIRLLEADIDLGLWYHLKREEPALVIACDRRVKQALEHFESSARSWSTSMSPIREALHQLVARRTFALMGEAEPVISFSAYLTKRIPEGDAFRLAEDGLGWNVWFIAWLSQQPWTVFRERFESEVAGSQWEIRLQDNRGGIHRSSIVTELQVQAIYGEILAFGLDRLALMRPQAVQDSARLRSLVARCDKLARRILA